MSGKNLNRPGGAVQGGTAGGSVAEGAFLNVRFICLGGVRGGRRYAGEFETF